MKSSYRSLFCCCYSTIIGWLIGSIFNWQGSNVIGQWLVDVICVIMIGCGGLTRNEIGGEGETQVTRWLEEIDWLTTFLSKFAISQCFKYFWRYLKTIIMDYNRLLNRN